MCHLVLLIPALALPIFWLMPLSSAVPIYVVIVLISAFLYWLMMRAMREPIQDGFQSLIGTQAEVVSRLSPEGYTKYMVRAGGELWSARCSDVLEPGETVTIAAVNGISLVVERRNNDSIAIEQAGVRTNEWHCH